jgi:cytidine deaminase
VDKQILIDMEMAAREAAENAHCPYSNFYVGSAVLGDDNKIYSGCNFENSAYGSTICSECNAIGSAITAGVKTIKAVLIFTPTDVHTYPCGNCRQVINEVAADIPIYSVCLAKEVVQTTLYQLLPNAYGPKNLYSTSTDSIK